jgi:hypothetical protein
MSATIFAYPGNEALGSSLQDTLALNAGALEHGHFPDG